MSGLVELYKGKEPMVRTLDLYERFGYKEHRKLKLVITKNLGEFKKRGEIINKATDADIRKVGQPDKSYLLNFKQLILLIFLIKNNGQTTALKTALSSSIVAELDNASLLAILDVIKNIDVCELDDDKYIYVAKEEVSGRYKIGISSNPEQRIKDLNIGNPEQLILVHAYLAREQGYQSEILAHSLFNEHRLKGEWFNSSINLNLLPTYSN